MSMLGQRSVAFWTVFAGICTAIGLVYTVLTGVISRDGSSTPDDRGATETTQPDRSSQTVSAGPTASVSASPTAPASPTPTSMVRWSSEVRLGTSGVLEFDVYPPAVLTGVLPYDRLTYDTGSGQPRLKMNNELSAFWPGKRDPSKDQCDEYLNTHRQSLAEKPVSVGMGMCVQTINKRTAFIRVKSATASEVLLAVTVWKGPRD